MTPEESKRLEATIQKTLSTHAKNDKSFLWMAYWVIFEREADQDGMTCHLDELQEGLSRADVIKKMIDSDEFRQRLSPVKNVATIR
jgi:hypothetical protein